MDRYILKERIGKGTYGTVFKGVDRSTEEHVALKTIDLDDEEGIPSTAIREIALLKWLSHNNVVRLHDVIHVNCKLYMVFELLELDLKQYIDICPTGLQMITIKSLLYQLLQGLSYCHSQHILHRDLKPANLLLNRGGTLKVADFGLARSFALPISSLKHEVITLWYRSPELLLGSDNYGTEVDMWSVGCILAEMISAKPLFNGATDAEQLNLILTLTGSPEVGSDLCQRFEALPLFKEKDFAHALTQHRTKVYSRNNILEQWPHLEQKDPDCPDLLSLLLELDPVKRITAAQALKHPFFDELRSRNRPGPASNQYKQQQQQQPPPPQQQPQPPQQPQQQPPPHLVQPQLQSRHPQQQQQQPPPQQYQQQPPPPQQYQQQPHLAYQQAQPHLQQQPPPQQRYPADPNLYYAQQQQQQQHPSQRTQYFAPPPQQPQPHHHAHQHHQQQRQQGGVPKGVYYPDGQPRQDPRYQHQPGVYPQYVKQLPQQELEQQQQQQQAAHSQFH